MSVGARQQASFPKFSNPSSDHNSIDSRSQFACQRVFLYEGRPGGSVSMSKGGFVFLSVKGVAHEAAGRSGLSERQVMADSGYTIV